MMFPPWLKGGLSKPQLLKFALMLAALVYFVAFGSGSVLAADNAPGGGHASEADSNVPQLANVSFFNGAVNGRTLLMGGLVVCALGVLFGLVVFTQLKNAPVHKSMLEVSELIYETCKTYLFTQAKFLGLLWLFIGAVIVVYYGVLKGESLGTVVVILALLASSASPAAPSSRSSASG